MPETSHNHRPVLVQAPVRALDPDGTGVITGGTAGFGIATIICWLNWGALTATGNRWYLGVALTGLALGLMAGLVSWTSRHWRRRLTKVVDSQGDSSVAADDTAE